MVLETREGGVIKKELGPDWDGIFGADANTDIREQEIPIPDISNPALYI